MNKIIIYPNENGGIVALIPAIDCGLTVEEIAIKDVPQNKKFKIIDTLSLPPEAQYWDEFFDALEYDFSDYDGIGGQQ